jgi:hypothetical protein
MPQIDFAAVKAMIALEQVLDLFSVPLAYRQTHRARGRCPFVCSESWRVCAYDLSRNVWHCFKCGRGGNQLDLFCAWKCLPLYDGAVELCRLLNVPVPYFEGPDRINGSGRPF